MTEQLSLEIAPDTTERRAATLVLIDGNAMAYRAYFALLRRGFQTRDGVPTGAVYGFVRMLLEVISKIKPEQLIVAFDLKGPTFRHEQFEDYKAHRKPMPDDLVVQMDLIKQVIQAFGLPIIAREGFEADDVIGTLSKQAGARGDRVLIVTGDQDTMQLVDDRVHVLLPRSGATELEEMDPAAVSARYGLTPSQIADYKGLRGDPSDNIPGVPGVGEKTATALLQQFGTLDALYARLDEVANAKLRDKLTANRAIALQSRHLATIDRNVPLPEVDWEACQLTLPDLDRLTQVLAALEFRTIIDQLPKILGDFLGKPADAPTSHDSPDPPAFLVREDQEARPLEIRPRVATNREELVQLVVGLRELATRPDALLAFDVETRGLNPLADGLVGISLAFADAECGADACNCAAWYVPVGHAEGSQLPVEEVVAAIRPFLEDPRLPKVAHNAKFDIHVLSQHGIQVEGLGTDTMVAHFLVASEGGHGLKDLAWTELRYRMTPISELIGTGSKALTMDRVAIDKAAPYAAADAAVTLELASVIRPRLSAEGVEALFTDVELPLIQVLAGMERHGIRLDVPHLEGLSVSMGERIHALDAEIQGLCGTEFNVNSPKQLAVVLFEKLQLPIVKKTKTGPSTDASVLEELAPLHPAVEKLLEYRQLTKLKSTYVDLLPTMINPQTGLVHTSYNQAGAATGRISSNDPNLQNIPIRTELGRQIRRAFLPVHEGHLLLSADYSQIELRVIAHIAQEQAFMRAFHEGIDIHALTASEIFEVPLDEVTAEHRRKAKAVNFGIVYGQSGFGLSRALGIPQKEARAIIQAFKDRYQGLARYNLETVLAAKRQGYVTTLLDRRRYLPELASSNRQLREFGERMAINTPIQGSAADLLKVAMVRIARALVEQGMKTAMVLTVHDELIFEVPPAELTQARELVKHHMETAFSLSVPLTVELHSALNWMDAK